MSKAVLIKEMPETCCDCMFVRELDEGIGACCEMCLDPEDNTLLRMIDGYCHGRPDWCPWRELPEEKPETEERVYIGSVEGIWKIPLLENIGWNACLREIGGEEVGED